MGATVSKIPVIAALSFFPLLIPASPLFGEEVDKLLPGSRVSLQEAVQTSQIIVTVKIVALGKKSARVSAGKLFYYDYKLKPVKTLKGEAPKEPFQTRLTLRIWPKDTAESLPTMDHEYLFFLIREQPTTLSAIKILSATDENIRDTKMAIRTANDMVN